MADREIPNFDILIKVIGLGGGGSSVLCRIAEDSVSNVELIAVDTSEKSLKKVSKAGIRTIQIGEMMTGGLGTGGKAEIGEKAAEAAEEKIRASFDGAQLVFITAGLGGGAGTGAAPVAARLAKETGIPSIAIVTMPFQFEGERKRRTAEAALEKMRGKVDALIVVRNDNLLKLAKSNLKLFEAFQLADDVLRQAILLVSDLIFTTGDINVDFADFKMVLRESDDSDAVLGIGESSGGSAAEAVRRAVESPLLSRTLRGAKNVILNIFGDEQLPLQIVEEAAEYVKQEAGTDVNLILGTVFNPAMKGAVKAMLVATGFSKEEEG